MVWAVGVTVVWAGGVTEGGVGGVTVGRAGGVTRSRKQTRPAHAGRLRNEGVADYNWYTKKAISSA